MKRVCERNERTGSKDKGAVMRKRKERKKHDKLRNEPVGRYMGLFP